MTVSHKVIMRLLGGMINVATRGRVSEARLSAIEERLAVMDGGDGATVSLQAAQNRINKEIEGNRRKASQ